LSEVISDTVGAMVTSNTESGITVAYDDADNTLDFTVGTLNQDTTGNAATATVLETARTIGGTSFNGSANIAVALAATSTALATARTIAGQSFDGSANITIASTDLSNTSNITLSDGAQTLTNKTLTSPVFSGTATNFESTGIDDNATSTAITIDSSENVSLTSILKVDTIQDQSGNNIINESADTITIGASGDTIALAGTTVTGITQGITEADMWRINAAYSYSGSQSFVDLTSNWERVDTDGFGKIGTGMTQSSGIFTFPLTGIYLINYTMHAETATSNSRFVGGAIRTTLDNSSYSEASEVNGNALASTMGVGTRTTVTAQFIFDVTSTSTHKIKFAVNSNVNSTTFLGNTTSFVTGVSFIRLGDT